MEEREEWAEQNEMQDEFKAVLVLLLDLLESGNTDRAMKRIREILNLTQKE